MSTTKWTPNEQDRRRIALIISLAFHLLFLYGVSKMEMGSGNSVQPSDQVSQTSIEMVKP